MNTKIKNNIYLISQELFYDLSLAILVFAVLEFIFPNSVLAYFNINYLLILWVFNAIIFLTAKKQ